jgi:hypothetical protein
MGLTPPPGKTHLIAISKQNGTINDRSLEFFFPQLDNNIWILLSNQLHVFELLAFMERDENRPGHRSKCFLPGVGETAR